MLIEGSGHVVLADFGVTAVMEQAESTARATRRGRDVVVRDSASSHEVSLLRVVLLSPSHGGAVICRDLALSHEVSPPVCAAWQCHHAAKTCCAKIWPGLMLQTLVSLA